MPMLKLSRRIQTLTPSATLVLTAKAKEMRAAGKDVIALTAGEPDFETPRPIRDAAIERLNEGGAVSRYTPTSGLPELRAAVAEKFRRDNGLDYAPAQTIVSCGGKHGLFNALAAIVDEGDEVVIPSPYWVSYPEMVKFLGGVPVYVDTSATGFVLTPEALKGALTERTRALVINSPGNPSGAVWSREAQAALARVLEGTEIGVVSDEIYEKLVYEGEHVSFASLSDDALSRTVTVNGVAKAFAMTGWRIGYSGGPEHVIRAMITFQSNSTSNATTVSQMAALAALKAGDLELDEWRRQYRQRRSVIVDGLNATDGLICAMPAGAFYAFADARGWFGRRHAGVELDDDTAITTALLERALVAVVPGSAFGAPGFLRLSYATSESAIRTALSRIQQFAGELQ